VDAQTVLVDFPYMLLFANAFDTKLGNRPKMAVLVEFYRNQKVSRKILHSS